MRFFVRSSSFQQKSIKITDANQLFQIQKVLRMKKGDICIFLPNDGREAVVEIQNISQKELRGEVLEWKECEGEPAQPIILVQAVPKSRSRWEYVLQKGTELGVTDFVPIRTERTLGKEPQRKRSELILKESAEQSERGKIPLLHNFLGFEEWLDSQKKSQEIQKSSFWVIGDSFDTNTPPLASYLKDAREKNCFGCIIGPEGGFSQKEIEIAKKHGVSPISLGPRILRTETAGMAIVSAFLLG